MSFPILQIIIVSNPEVTIFNLILTSTCQQKALLPFILRVSLKNRETGLFCSLLHYLLKSFSPEHIPLPEFTLLYACTHMISIVTSKIHFPFTNKFFISSQGNHSFSTYAPQQQGPGWTCFSRQARLFYSF